MTEVGQVIRFDHRKGYGFINVLNSDSENYGRELFFHFSEIQRIFYNLRTFLDYLQHVKLLFENR